MQSTMFQPNMLKLTSAAELRSTSPVYPCANNPQNLIPQEVHSNSSLSRAIDTVMINDHNGSNNQTVVAQAAPQKICANDHTSIIIANASCNDSNLSFLGISVIYCNVHIIYTKDPKDPNSCVPLVKPLHGDGLHQTHAVSKCGTAVYIVFKTVTDFIDIWMAAKHISIRRIRSKPIP